MNKELTISEAWKAHCKKLYARVLEIEKQAESDYLKHIKNEVPYAQRRQKLKQCDKYKKLIKESAENKTWNLDGDDAEIILEKGFDYYFNYYCIL